MNIFAIGDLHLSFSSDKPMDIYGGQWVDHAKRIKENWELLVDDQDVVIVAGDISWALKPDEAIADLDFIAGLPGQKVLLKGNHDLWWTSISRLNNMYDNMYFIQNTYYKAGEYAICGSRGWICPEDTEFTQQDEKIYRREAMRLRSSLQAAKNNGEEKIIGVLHYPPAASHNIGSEFTRIFSEFGVKLVIYGHLHGEEAHSKAIRGVYGDIDYRLVSCDYLGCRPLKLDLDNI